ncbi:phosphatidylcholine/phosphatidylserine synthase [Geminicoccaceae bacterium 1502E]|nr:phosphatidylcholine/phosphatidylserine synthase [Geminicoccaceae bacterium 1502E]
MLRSRSPRRHRLKARPLLHLVPNMFTILSLCAGLTALRYALDERWQLAVALILVAGVLDGLDGRSARMLNIQSKLGAELDSLADFFNFGVAPALIVYLWTLSALPGLGWALALLFATCCALRLARFNSELDKPDRPRWSLYFFTGIPAPAAAGLALTPMMLSFIAGAGWPRSWWINAVMLLFVAMMMVSKVPTFSVKRLRIKPDYVLPTLLLVGLLTAFLVTEPWLALSVLGVCYLASIPFSVIVARRLRRQEEAGVPAAEAGPAASPASHGGEPPESVLPFGQRHPKS